MLKNIMNGLIWGVGFSISTATILSLWLLFVLPEILSHGITTTEIPYQPAQNTQSVPFVDDFSELSLDDKITKSTAIIATKVEKNDEGKYQSRVTEILKKQDGVELYYEVGEIFDDDHPYLDEYESKKIAVPEGFIVFMSENPATMQFSTSYSGERIRGLGNISFALLRKKCTP